MTIPVDLYADLTGLTLEAQPVDASNSPLGSPLTSGFVEIGGGAYLWTVPTLPAGMVAVRIQNHANHAFTGTTISASTVASQSLAGPSSVTITFNDSNGAAVANVIFAIVGQGSSQANSSGVAAFGLSNGTYTVVASPTAGVVFPQATLTVNGTTTLTITGPAATIPSVPGAGRTIVSGVTVDQAGNVFPNATITFRRPYQPGVISATSDGAGSVSVDLAQSANYAWAAPSGSSNYFTTPASSSLSLGNMVGDWSGT